MLEETQQAPSKKPANLKWIVLAISGACAGIACLVLIVVLVGAVLSPRIGGILNQIRLLPSYAPESTKIATTEINPSPLKNANYMGNPNAPVKMIEYADFQCPYCRLYWHDTEPGIIQSYVMTGKVYYEYRSVGAFIGPESAAAAEAAYCAGDQGKFWEFHDTLFTNWTGENVGDFTPTKLRQYASTVGLNQVTFDNCVKNGTHSPQVLQDAVDAKTDGIQATPSFLINGKVIEGAQPYEVFRKAIDAALNGK